MSDSLITFKAMRGMPGYHDVFLGPLWEGVIQKDAQGWRVLGCGVEAAAQVYASKRAAGERLVALNTEQRRAERAAYLARQGR